MSVTAATAIAASRPIYSVNTGRATGWYDTTRLNMQGPYADIRFADEDVPFIPDAGPLAGTRVTAAPLWCGVHEGKLVVAPRTSDQPPPPFTDAMRVRGFYAPGADAAVEWYHIGDPWNDEEIEEYRLLSNPAYRLYARVPVAPKHVLYFGAGASFGSDHHRLTLTGELPPLGNNLFEALHADSALPCWRGLPPNAVNLFRLQSFEDAMLAMENMPELEADAWDRDLQLALYFSRFRPTSRNLYWRLARRIVAKQLSGWTGAAVTLNYERLLEESFMRNRLFTPVKGVTWYDDNVPMLRDDQLFEIAYPHGACHFFIAQDMFELVNGGKVVFPPTARMLGNTGANHLLKRDNIPRACEMHQFPLICRYEPSKRPSIGSYFIDGQQGRARELVLNAETVTLVGVRCTFPGDMHLWGPLGETPARIRFVEPGAESRDTLRKKWAVEYGKVEGNDFKILASKFEDAFERICTFNGL